MKNRDGLENNDNWETPQDLYDSLNEEFHFDFDPCPLNADFDGLSIEWENLILLILLIIVLISQSLFKKRLKNGKKEKLVYY